MLFFSDLGSPTQFIIPVLPTVSIRVKTSPGKKDMLLSTKM